MTSLEAWKGWAVSLLNKDRAHLIEIEDTFSGYNIGLRESNITLFEIR